MSTLEERTTASPQAYDLIRLIRPHQWAKNFMAVPVALIDAPGGPTLPMIGRVCWAIVLFTLASSIIYVVNDMSDRRRDSTHPVKRHRPIASGRVPVALAATFAFALAALLTVAAILGPGIPAWPLVAYIGLNLVYSRWLRHIALVDTFVVALGFVLRVLFGYLAIRVATSSWLLISVFLLCLLLILGKRRHEVSTLGAAHRPSLRGYSVQYLDYLMVLSAVLTFVSFLLYLRDATFAVPYTDTALLVSAPCGLFALARFIQVVVVQGEGGDPVRVLLHDHPMVFSCLIWTVLLGLTALAARHPALMEGVLT